MKKNIKFSVLIFTVSVFVVLSCSNDSQSDKKKVEADSIEETSGELLNQRSFEITTAGDTINIKDENGLKQGVWITNTGVLLANGGVKKDTAYYKDGQLQNK